MFAIDINRQMLVDSFLLYDESSVANSPINMVYIIRVTSVSILEVCSYREDLTDIAKAALYSYPHWKLTPFPIIL